MSRKTSFGRRVVSVVAALALLSVGVTLRGQLPKPDDLVYSQFDYTQSAPLLGEISNVRVTTGETLGGRRTHAAWVVVDYTFTPDAFGSLDAELISEDGTIYAKLPQGPCKLAYPGLTTECTLAFEMPLDQLPGAVVHLNPGSTSMAPRLVVPLENPVATRDIVRERFEL